MHFWILSVPALPPSRKVTEARKVPALKYRPHAVSNTTLYRIDKVNAMEKRSDNPDDARIRELQERLDEAEANLEAIRSGQADAIVVETETGSSVFTIQGADVAYRIMVETMNEGALTLDPQGVILYANSRFAEMLNIPLPILTGKLLQTFVATYQEDEFNRFVDETVNGAKLHQDFELLRQDMSVVPVYLSSTPLGMLDRKDICIIISDLTSTIDQFIRGAGYASDRTGA
jgi:PAS domain S-box-containing protein